MNDRCHRGSVLVGLLWCLALLSVLVIGVLHAATLDLRLARNQGDEIQARYLALAGIEKAKALLYHEAWERRRSRVNHSGRLRDDAASFRDVPLGRGQFRVMHSRGPQGAGKFTYGVLDEESRLDVNRASAEELSKLPGLTAEEAAAIVDYRDGDQQVTQSGAEAEQYAALTPPRRPRNGAFLTRRELLSVLGLSARSFLGEDGNLNGMLDDNEDDGPTASPADNADGRLDGGWSEFVTTEAQVRNVNAAGQSRVNIKEASVAELSAVSGISRDLAEAMVRHRDQNNFENLADLLEVRAPGPNNGANNPSNAAGSARRNNAGDGGERNAGPANNPPSGAPLISESLFMELADDLTVESSMDLPGVINVNSAPEEVLVCLEGMTRELAHEIVSYRESSGYFSNTARLLELPGMSRELWKRLAPRLSAKSQTFRILSEGWVPSTGARRRVECVVRVGTFYVDTLTYREDDL